MDNVRTPNPLLQPPDEVLWAIVRLMPSPDLQVISGWVQSCYAATVNRLSGTKDEVDARWQQGQAQALMLVLKALTQAGQELKAREEKAKQNQIQRNL